MIAALKDFTDRVFGRGDAAITVPPFDGALKPNQLLEEAAVVCELDAPEDLATDGQAVFVADGARILRLDAGGPVEVAAAGGTITALACLPGGGFAVALDGERVRLMGGVHDGRTWDAAGGRAFKAVNALSAAPDGGLLATDGSQARPYAQWSHDLMELGRSGRLIQLSPADGGAREIASGLAYAFGACAADGTAWVCESWRHRVMRYNGTGAGAVVVDRLPAYPSRLTPAAGGGYWLTAFTARTQLIEFILREPAYRKRMMAEIDPRYWMAPSLSASTSFLEPMQGAHIKTMGILKPWAPPRSYGLVMRLTPEGLVRYSLHSRVDGTHHGVVAAVECGGALTVLSKGRRRVLRLDVAEIERSLQA